MLDTTFKKGHIAWNKGKTGLQTHSEEVRKKMSLAKLGKPSNRIMTEELKEKIRQKNIGRKRSEETRRKQSEARRGKEPWNKGKKGLMVAWNKGKKLSNEHCEKLSESHKGNPGFWEGKKRSDNVGQAVAKRNKEKRGDKHWNWQDGITPINQMLRQRIETKEWRQKVFERDNFTCQKYGLVRDKIQAHHIHNWADYPKLRHELSNGITLSKKAHDEFHSKYGRRNTTYEQLKEFLEPEEIKIAI